MTTTPWVAAEPRSVTTASPVTTFERRADALIRLRRSFDVLARESAFACTGWSAWAFAETFVSESPSTWAALAHYPSGDLAGLLLFSEQQLDDTTLVTLAGTEQGFRGVLTVDSPETAELLAAEVAHHIADRAFPAELMLGPLDANDPAVHAFAAGLGGSRLVPDHPVPTLVTPYGGLTDVLSHGTRRTLRKAQNRVSRDGRQVTIGFTRAPSEILAMAPHMEQCHRERDHMHGRPSDLDHERGRKMWRWRLTELANLGALELSSLYLDGEFAAYALGVLDGHTYRVLEGRFVTAWARYAPGRLLEAAMLERVLESPSLRRTDWMSSVAPETLIAANDADPMVRIYWSHRP